MTKRTTFCVKIIFMGIAIIAMVLAIAAATDRTITIVKATLVPTGEVFVTYKYRIGPEHQMRATAYSYGEWVSALRSKGWKVTEAWK